VLVTKDFCYPPAMPPREYHFWVYIMASRSLQLYVGFTNNLRVRVAQHKELRPGTYTARYNITRLVYFEHYTYVLNGIAREKELKDWNREKKLALIKSSNPAWQDLSKTLWPEQFDCD
jgi:putative endonuclease